MALFCLFEYNILTIENNKLHLVGLIDQIYAYLLQIVYIYGKVQIWY